MKYRVISPQNDVTAYAETGRRFSFFFILQYGCFLLLLLVEENFIIFISVKTCTKSYKCDYITTFNSSNNNTIILKSNCDRNVTHQVITCFRISPIKVNHNNS